jgi:hypothetical protein
MECVRGCGGIRGGWARCRSRADKDRGEKVNAKHMLDILLTRPGFRSKATFTYDNSFQPPVRTLQPSRSFPCPLFVLAHCGEDRRSRSSWSKAAWNSTPRSRSCSRSCATGQQQGLRIEGCSGHSCRAEDTEKED